MNVLFDLDGTLTDPELGITRCLAHALERFGRAAPPREDLRRHIGPPLQHVMADLLETDDPATVDAAVEAYRARYRAVGQFECAVCEGVPALLHGLRDRGRPMWVATSKPTEFAETVVRHFGLDDYFGAVHGPDLDYSRSDKTELIAHVLSVEGIAPEETVMIGDRSFDVAGARANGVRSIGVLWGFGSRAELESAGADRIAETPDDLAGMLESGDGRCDG